MSLSYLPLLINYPGLYSSIVTYFHINFLTALDRFLSGRTCLSLLYTLLLGYLQVLKIVNFGCFWGERSTSCVSETFLNIEEPDLKLPIVVPASLILSFEDSLLSRSIEPADPV